jgi:hypothetical protein
VIPDRKKISVKRIRAAIPIMGLVKTRSSISIALNFYLPGVTPASHFIIVRPAPLHGEKGAPSSSQSQSEQNVSAAKLFRTSRVYTYEKTETEVREALVPPPSSAKFPPHFAGELNWRGPPPPLREDATPSGEIKRPMILFHPLARIL